MSDDFDARIPARAAKSLGVGDTPQQARTAEERAELADVFRQHHAFVWRSLVHYGLPPTTADDALQDVFLVVHRRLPDYHGGTPMRGWLYGIARRVASEYRRGKRRAIRTLQVVADPDAHPGDEGFAERVSATDRVQRLLATLDPERREVFILSELEGMTAVEIAQALELNVNTVYGRIRTAKKRFAAALKRQQAEEQRLERRS